MRKVKFEDVATRVNTREDKDNTSLLYYVGGDHIESGEMVVHNRGLIAGSTIGPMFYFGFKKGDILLVSRNPHLRKAAMVRFDGICSEKTFVIGTKDESVLLQRYLAVVVQTDSFWNYCEEHKSGGVNFFVNWSTLAKYEFELPDLEEQRIISDKVWAAYEVKESYRKLISATDEMVKSRFIEMFRDNDYQIVPLGELCKKITDGSHNPPKGIDHSQYLMISSQNVFSDALDLSDVRYLTKEDFENEDKRTSVSQGDILLTIVGTIGRVYLVSGNEGNIALQRSVAVLTPNDRITSRFLMCSFLYDDDFSKEGRGNAQKGVYLKQLSHYTLRLPSIDNQKAFEEIYKQADKSKFELKHAIEKIDKVMRALMQ